MDDTYRYLRKRNGDEVWWMEDLMNVINVKEKREKRRKIRNSTQLLDLPNEMLRHIFSHLKKEEILYVGLVCKRMFSIACDVLKGTLGIVV